MPYVWVDSTWVASPERLPIVLLFGRDTSQREKVRTFRIKGFEPHFFACADDTNHPPEATKVYPEVQLDALGRNVRRIATRIPTDVRAARESYTFTDEADIVFDKRFVIDKDIWYGFDQEPGGGDIYPVDCSILPSRLLYLDIEVRSPWDQVAQPQDPKFPTIMIQTLDSYTEEIKLFTYGIPKVADDQVALESEIALYGAFIKYVMALDPDVLTGWYSNGFDMPYLIKRSEYIKSPLRGLGRLANSTPYADFRGTEWSVRVQGRQSIDMMDAFKKFYKAEGELPAYDLKSIAASYAGFAYKAYGGSIDALMRDEDWKTLLEYGRNDVRALLAIDKKAGLFSFYDNLRATCGVKLEDTLRNSVMIESLLMRNHIKPMPTRKYSVKQEKYRGALVIDPPVGISRHVVVLDAKALYPTIIIAFNISPDIDKMIPKVIIRVLAERDKIRAKRAAGQATEDDKKKEIVLKFLTTSFYGVLGWPGFRLYRVELAAEITRRGREINELIQKWIRELGYTPIYGDTDSVFAVEVRSLEEAIKIQDYVNVQLKQWAESLNCTVIPTVKVEEMFETLMFKKKSTGKGVAKKRYAGKLIWKEGDKDVPRLEYTGVEIKRTDASQVTKDVMKEFLSAILMDEDEKKAIGIIKKYGDLVRGGKVSLKQVGLPKGIHKRDANTAWARGVRNSEKYLGMIFREAIKPKLIYTLQPEDVVCIMDDVDETDVLSKIQVNWPLMYEKTVADKMRPLVESLGMNWNVVMKGQTVFGGGTW